MDWHDSTGHQRQMNLYFRGEATVDFGMVHRVRWHWRWECCWYCCSGYQCSPGHHFGDCYNWPHYCSCHCCCYSGWAGCHTEAGCAPIVAPVVGSDSSGVGARTEGRVRCGSYCRPSGSPRCLQLDCCDCFVSLPPEKVTNLHRQVYMRPSSSKSLTVASLS